MNNVYQESIYNYSDYRDYVRDYYHERKSESKAYSLQWMADRLGLTKMAVKFLIDKKRHLADETLTSLAEVLGLQRKARLYFYYLALFNKAQDPDKRHRYFTKMMNLRGKLIGEKTLSDSEIGYFKSWFYPVIAEMSYLKNFKKDPAWIQRRINFKVSAPEIREALEFLDANGYLKGSVAVAAKIKLPDVVRSHVYRKFVREQIEKAAAALDTVPVEDREFFNLTISVDPSRYDLAKKMIAEFRHKLHDTLANEAECERVIQINMQMFTVSKDLSPKEEQ